METIRKWLREYRCHVLGAQLWCSCVAIDTTTKCPLYVQFTENECNADYKAAFDSITSRGYKIKGIVVDGRHSLFKMLPDVPVQMCQFHMLQIVRRYITLNPKMHVCRELRDIVNKICSVSYVDFKSAYEAWRAVLIRKCNEQV